MGSDRGDQSLSLQHSFEHVIDLDASAQSVGEFVEADRDVKTMSAGADIAAKLKSLGVNTSSDE